MSFRSKYHVNKIVGQLIIGPPLGWTKEQEKPDEENELHVANIPKNCQEDELIALFEKVGKIYKLRLISNYYGESKGYCFVQYFHKQDAERAITLLNKFEIRDQLSLVVKPSKNQRRLFFGRLPPNISNNDVLNELINHTDGIKSIDCRKDSQRDCSFALVEFNDIETTESTFRKFQHQSIKMFGRKPKVDWALPNGQRFGNELTNNSFLYVRFTKRNVTVRQFKEYFSIFHQNKMLNVWQVRKHKDYAFIEYEHPEDAQLAYEYFQSIDLSQTPMNEPNQKLVIKLNQNGQISSPLVLRSSQDTGLVQTNNNSPTTLTIHYDSFGSFITVGDNQQNEDFSARYSDNSSIKNVPEVHSDQVVGDDNQQDDGFWDRFPDYDPFILDTIKRVLD